MHKKQSVVATIGNFDGLHIGHQKIIARVVEKARECKGIPTVITFYPLPAKVLRPEQPFFQLMSFSEKWLQLKALGIEKIIRLRFNKTLMQMSAEDFVKKILVEKINVTELMVGEDFRFGSQQQGDVALLQAIAKKKMFKCAAVVVESLDGMDKISSTHIRHALLAGNMSAVTRWLGRPYAMMGKVIYGRQHGRLWGIPTANMAIPIHRQGLKGIFIAEVHWRGKSYPAVVNMGTRPTVDGKRMLLEAHLLDFTGDLYGERVNVALIEKIRDEKRFNDIAQLRAQIEQDITHGRAYFEKV